MIVNPISYPGNKNKLLSQIIPELPNNCSQIVEIFCGSGVVSINSNINNILLNDISIHAIDLLNYFYTTSFENIMPQFLSVIVFVGIVLSYVQPETISKLIGTSSGFLGIIFSAIIGSITLLPTFVAFSLGNTLLSSGAGYSQVAALISTLTLVGMMTFSMEAKFIGKWAAFLRNFLAFLFSFIVALFVGKVMMVI